MRKFLILNVLFLATSCFSSVKGSWSCPTPEGGKGSCVSIKEADTVESTSKDKPNFSYLNSTQKIEIKLIAPKLSDLKKIQKDNQAEQHKLSYENNLLEEKVFEGSEKTAGSSKQDTRLRTQEKIGKIWFAPYIDAEGNQHSESVVHVVDEEPRWEMQR